MAEFDVPRGNCRRCGGRLDAHDYWFWWLRRYHRRCLEGKAKK